MVLINGIIVAIFLDEYIVQHFITNFIEAIDQLVSEYAL